MKNTSKNKPNIVLIVADDIGYGDFSCYNEESKIITENIDKVAKNGMKFLDAHSTSAVCTPSRYSILTGEYCWRSSLKSSVITGYERPLIKKGKSTIASELKGNGYNTGYFGKWHLGLGFRAKDGEYIDFNRSLPWSSKYFQVESKIDFEKPVWGGPIDLGFDRFFGTTNSSTSQPPYGFIEDRNFISHPYEISDAWTFPPEEDIYEDNVPFWWKERTRAGMTAKDWNHKDVDVILTGKTEEFIDEQKDKDEPFFLMLAANSCHEPCYKEYVPEFARGKSDAGYRGDMVWLFDWMVGKVYDKLEATGQLENTIIMITSDNGALPGSRTTKYHETECCYDTYDHKSCGDLKGFKAHIWEGGHREPFIVSYPNHIEANSISNELFSFNDIYKTLAEFAGCQVAENQAVDSIDLSKTMLQEATNQRPDIVHHSQTGVFAIRKDGYKLILETESSGGWAPPEDMNSPVLNGKGQLYNLNVDPYEENNLYDTDKEKVFELIELLKNYQE